MNHKNVINQKSDEEAVNRRSRITDTTKELLLVRRQLKEDGKDYTEISRILRNSLKKDLREYRIKKYAGGEHVNDAVKCEKKDNTVQ